MKSGGSWAKIRSKISAWRSPKAAKPFGARRARADRGDGRRAEKGSQGQLATYEGPAGCTRFQRDFAEIREAAAIAAGKSGDEALSKEIRTLQFRDLRRTCVVYFGELGLEDHLIAAITGHDIDETRRILKTYMPRTTGRATRAVALATMLEAKEKEK